MVKRDKALQQAIGARVQAVREQKGMSRTTLAKVIGLSDGQSLYKYERGDRGFNPTQLGKIADELDVSIEYLYHGVEHADRVANKSKAAAASAQDPQGVLVPPGLDVAIPAPILDLINLGWVNPITNDDIRHLRVHLGTGGSSLPLDLLVAVWGHRTQLDGSDENLRALNDAVRRRADAAGLKRLTESDIPPSPTPFQGAVNADAMPRPKRLGPRNRRKRP